MKLKVAIIGRGSVGTAIRQGLDRAGYEVKSTGRELERVREAAGWGQLIILAVPYSALDEALSEMGDAVGGKPLVDVSNALTPDHRLAIGFSTSGAEELQKKAQSAKVVKAFNTVFAEHMPTGRIDGTALTLFAAGDDGGAREQVLNLARDIGFDAVDAGPLENARWLEALGYFNIQLGFALGMGRRIGFKLVH